MLKTNIDHHIRYIRSVARAVGKGRLLRLGLAFLLLISIFVPIAQEINTQQRYNLSTSTIRLVGETNKNLVKKITFDSQNAQWQFNKDGIKTAETQNSADPMAALKSQIGGAGKKDDSLYSVDLAKDGKKGVTYYDNNTDLSFSVVPKFSVTDGQVRNGKLVYPISSGAKIVYTAMNNGMKEDIVLSHNIGNTLQFRYQLNLPETLQAKILDDGSVGIYSADPTLFGDISFGTDMDREKVESARKSAVKDHLLFAIPAPIIKQTGSEQMSATAQFRLEGSELILYANNMNSATYPASVDPSVVVTSSSDFSAGNNEGNIDFVPGQINRGALTGGSTATWNATTSLANTRTSHSTVAYNGYIYAAGGTTPDTNDVVFAPINSDGTIGAWTPTSSFANTRNLTSLVAYNGYMYIIGGFATGTYYSDVQYAVVNSNGSLGTWGTTMSLAFGRSSTSAVAYNGYMYVVGGRHNTNDTQCNPTASIACTDVLRATINADGTLGTWYNVSNFDTARYAHTAVAYNGYLYVIGGQFSTTYYNDVQYAKISPDGSIGSWSYTSSFTTGRFNFTATTYNGYLYIMAGLTASSTYANDTQYVMINANGTLGTWNTTASITTARSGLSGASYNGYLYVLGGTGTAGALYADVQYAKINGPGATTAYAATTPLTATTSKAPAVAYNGYLYELGTGSVASTTVRYTAISSSGTVGAWATTTAFPTARIFHSAFAYNGYMYVVGGQASISTSTGNVSYAPISANGTLGAWTSTATMTAAESFGLATYRGYVYVTGGYNRSIDTNYNTVQYAAINPNGTLGTWATGTSFTTVRSMLKTVAYGGYLYISGGSTNAITYFNDVQYAPINANGTVGTWSTTSSFTTGRGSHLFVAYNGYLYLGGGSNNTDQSDVQYALVNANGTLGTWSANTSLPATRTDAGFDVYKGYVYLVGGTVSGAASADVSYAQINNGGTGSVGPWGTTTSLTSARYAHATTIYNGCVYVLGGYNGAYLNTVQYAPINPDGTFGPWNTTTAFTNGRYGFAATAYNGYLYVMGGYNGSSFLNDVQYAPIDVNGVVGTWKTTTAFPTARYSFGFARYNGYLYILGGWNGSALGDVQYANITSNGTVGTWTATTAFTTARYGTAVTAYNGFLYIAAGRDPSGFFSDVQYAPINSGGTVGSWTAANSIRTARSSPTLNAYNGYLYFLGGGDGSGSYNDVQYAAVNANGSLDKWNTSTSFTNGRNASTTEMYGGYMYIFGGTGASTYGDVQYTPVSSIARTGQYSKLIDLGGLMNLSSVTYGGRLADGATGVSFRVAGTDGVFTTAANASLSTISSFSTGTCGSSGARYIFLSITLDDAAISGGFADNLSTTNANLTDVTVNYASANSHPQPQQRLRGGKFFQTEALQPLDTCGP